MTNPTPDRFIEGLVEVAVLLTGAAMLFFVVGFLGMVLKVLVHG